MFRFTIRDVLWLMVVVGMGIGWLLSVWQHRDVVEQQRYRIQILEIEAKELRGVIGSVTGEWPQPVKK